MGCLHMTIQTAVLIETLAELGADVRWVSCNIFSTQDHAAAAVVVGRPETGGTAANPKGTPVFAWKGETLEEYWWCTSEALVWPDGGGPDAHRRRRRRRDAARAQGRSSSRRPARCRRSTPTSDPEEWGVILDTAPRGCSARHPARGQRIAKRHPRRQRGDDDRRAPPLPDERSRARCSSRPSTSTTRSPRASSTTSTAAATRCPTASTRATDVMLGGKVAVVFGYGEVGKGCAQALRGQGCRVIVTEIDPICALQAAMEGYEVATLEDVRRARPTSSSRRPATTTSSPPSTWRG